ncbi:hypothetical protein K493DRAFT_314215 [Basidiobolus meristosporus CBS 931.73]|uniref:Extracellular membrane protein CFEM domain-containing protein n=1 Tax=Basidiobolus meristosporus CBS 931.73 TaxID=1314790 RepID=A0A1Y1YGX9_9FUNG|nr:hypothetical protein K493DRAFT_314215 [Basidiobolus meristosporus CBS 931.73]|eukprot:ORX97123.1 hypothetical protein K493DRAFT_314215 [Basidiobolus meristosporus CBS 931.73]
MKLTSVLLVSIVGAASAAENFAPELPANSTCIGNFANTYVTCRSNALKDPCLSNDYFCNCRQSQSLATCIGYCQSDPNIYSNLPRQQAETEKWCPLVTSTPTPSPTATTTNPGTTSASGTPQKTNILSGSSSLFDRTTLSSITLALFGLTYMLF